MEHTPKFPLEVKASKADLSRSTSMSRSGAAPTYRESKQVADRNLAALSGRIFQNRNTDEPVLKISFHRSAKSKVSDDRPYVSVTLKRGGVDQHLLVLGDAGFESFYQETAHTKSHTSSGYVSFGGRGIGKSLMQYMWLDYAVQDLNTIYSCSYPHQQVSDCHITHIKTATDYRSLIPLVSELSRYIDFYRIVTYRRAEKHYQCSIKLGERITTTLLDHEDTQLVDERFEFQFKDAISSMAFLSLMED